MKVPLKITFRGLEASRALSDFIRFRVVDLVREHAHVAHVDVILDAAAESLGEGGRYRAAVRAGGIHVDGLARQDGHDHPCRAIDAAFTELRARLRPPRSAAEREVPERTTTRLRAVRWAS